MNVTQYKRLTMRTGKVDTCDFTAHHGANIDGKAGMSRLRALELVNNWNQRVQIPESGLGYLYWIER